MRNSWIHNFSIFTPKSVQNVDVMSSRGTIMRDNNFYIFSIGSGSEAEPESGLLMREREREREERGRDGTRTWDAHVRSRGRSDAINRSGRFISRRAATAATRSRGCSRGDFVPNEQLLPIVSSRYLFHSFLKRARVTRYR